MNRHFLVFGICCQLLASFFYADTAASQTQQDEKLTAEVELAAEQVRAAIPDAWQVDASGEQILIRYQQPVKFSVISANPPAIESGAGQQAAEQSNSIFEQECAFTLRFADKLPLAEYVRQNARRELELEQLRDGVRRIAHKFDDFLPQDEAERKQLIAYRRGMAKLSQQDLPDLFTTAHGIYLTRSWSAWESVHNEQVRSQVEQVEKTLAHLFGIYDPLVAAGRRVPLGKFSSTSNRDYRIATVLGEDIYRCQINPTGEWRAMRAKHLQEKGDTPGLEAVESYRKQMLSQMVFQPLIENFRKEYPEAVEVTDEEIENFLVQHRRIKNKQQSDQGRPLGERTPEQENFFARWYLGNWKLQKAFYEKYGGRVIWQQVGPEAIDAMRDFLHEKTEEGQLEFHDSRLKEIFWEPFLRDKPGVVLPNPKEIFSGDWEKLMSDTEK